MIKYLKNRFPEFYNYKMDFTELLKNRRSVRNYKEKNIPTEILYTIINESILAPSAGNEQPWKFIIVNNREMLNRISDDSKKNILKRISQNPNDYAKKYERMLQKESFNIFYHAPAVIFIIGDARLKNLYVDCALVASYIMMSATAKGLGTCWVNFGTEIYDPEIINELNLPANHKIVAPIAIGYPEKIPAAPKRKEPQILKVIN